MTSYLNFGISGHKWSARRLRLHSALGARPGGHILGVFDDDARTFTIPANASVAYPIGTCLTFINAINTVTIAINSVTLSNGDRDAACTDVTFSAVRATRGNNSGKRYFEISVPTAPSSSRAGFADKGFTLTTYLGNARISAGAADGGGVNVNGGGFNPQMSISTAVTVPAMSNGDYLQFAIDFTTGKAWVGRNGTWLSSGNPTTGANPWIVRIPGAMWPACSLYDTGSYRLHTTASQFQGLAPSGYSAWARGTHAKSGFAMVGDSITLLYPTTDDWRTLSGYGTAMEYGVASNTSTQTLDRFPNILAAKPKAVFMMIGVNDVSTGIATATSQSNVDAIIDLCQADSVPIYVEKILPLAASYAGGRHERRYRYPKRCAGNNSGCSGGRSDVAALG